MKNEFEYYNEISNWDFSMIKYEAEYLTNWNMYDLLKKYATKDSKILDLGTAAGEKFIIRGVDMMDCWNLKKLLNCGQAYHDAKLTSIY